MNRDDAKPAVVALGTFDGMHIGHRAVVARAVEIARARGWRAVVYTFENHPRSVFGKAPRLLMSADERRRAMLEMGVDEVDMLLFDRQMAELSPHDFLARLRSRYDVRAVVAGSDYTFGHRGAGTIETLKREGERSGFAVHEIPFVMLDGEKVSSTRIREAIERGDESSAKEMLGKH